MTKNSEKIQEHHDDDDVPLTIAELEVIAQKKLRKQVWDYYVSGSDEQTSTKRNRDAYTKYVAKLFCFVPQTVLMKAQTRASTPSIPRRFQY